MDTFDQTRYAISHSTKRWCTISSAWSHKGHKDVGIIIPLFKILILVRIFSWRILQDSIKTLGMALISHRISRAPSHTQLHNKEDEGLKVVYGFIWKYRSNWAFVYFCRPNQEDNSRMKECTNISKKTSNSLKYKLELWSEEHKKTEFQLTSQHYFWVKL